MPKPISPGDDPNAKKQAIEDAKAHSMTAAAKAARQVAFEKKMRAAVQAELDKNVIPRIKELEKIPAALESLTKNLAFLSKTMAAIIKKK